MNIDLGENMAKVVRAGCVTDSNAESNCGTDSLAGMLGAQAGLFVEVFSGNLTNRPDASLLQPEYGVAARDPY